MTVGIGRPRFVTLEEAMGWHEISISQHGGSMGVRDRGLLESALAQARQQFGGQYAHEFPFGMASAYAYFIAKNHPFVDGNKRAALLCCGAFLRMNGWDLVSEGEEAADAVLELVAGERDRESFSQWLQSMSKPRPSMELRDFFALIEPARFSETFRALLPGETGAAPLELVRTAEEAGAVVPLIADLARQQGEARQSRDEADWERITMIAVGMLALYRIAEDMGYEW